MKFVRSATRAHAAVRSACISSPQHSSVIYSDVEYSAGTFTKLFSRGLAQTASPFAPTGFSPKRDRDHLTYNSHLGAVNDNISLPPNFASQGFVQRSTASGITGHFFTRGFRSEAPRGKDEEPKSSATSPSPSSFDELEALAATQLEIRDDDELLEDFRALNLNNEEDRAKLQAQLAISSKRQQKLLLDQAMRNFKIEYPSLEEEMDFLGYDISDFEMSVVNVNRTCKSTKAGGLYRYSSIVVCGDGKGLVGYALAKGPEPQPATQKAYRLACKRVQYFSLFENQTIWHETTAKFCKTKVIMLPARSGTGLRCNKVIGTVCKHVGIKDIIAKVVGSHDPHNTLHATFLALQNVLPPDELSELRGRHVEVY